MNLLKREITEVIGNDVFQVRKHEIGIDIVIFSVTIQDAQYDVILKIFDIQGAI